MAALVVSAAASYYPVTTAEAKAHMRVDTSADDTYIAALIAAATGMAELYTRRRLVRSTWTLYLDRFPAAPKNTIELPYPPLASVSSVVYLDGSGCSNTLTANTDYQVDTYSFVGRLAVAPSSYWPETQTDKRNAVTITYVAGYTASDDTEGSAVPAPIKQGILITAAHWYEHREPVITGTIITPVPMSAEYLWDMYKVPGEFQYGIDDG